jgi:hypothetical protein
VSVPASEPEEGSTTKTDEIAALPAEGVETPPVPSGKPGVPFTFSSSPTPASSPSPVAPASPLDWGAASTPTPGRTAPARPASPPSARTGTADKKAKAEPTLEQHLAASWRKTRAGLFWVGFALFWLAIIGMVPFGKTVYARSVGPLPKGDGQVKIAGYVNDDSHNAIKINAEEELDLLLYGVPIVLGGLAMILGRLTCGAVPQNSGAKGLFAFSGLFALIAFAGLLTIPVASRAGYQEIEGYARLAAIVCGAVSEFWFLLALGACGATLRRPKAVRAVGLFALVLGLTALVITVGWDSWLKYGEDLGRPKEPDADWLLYEEAAKMLGWVFVVGMYSRAVGGVRRAIREYLADAGDRKVTA